MWLATSAGKGTEAGQHSIILYLIVVCNFAENSFITLLGALYMQGRAAGVRKAACVPKRRHKVYLVGGVSSLALLTESTLVLSSQTIQLLPSTKMNSNS